MKQTTKEQAHFIQEAQQDYLQDIDMSGSLLLEYEKVTPKL